MGLTSLILSIIAIIVFFLFFAGGVGIVLSAPLSLLGLIFGIIGIKKKENTAIAGTVISVLVLIADIFLFVVVINPFR